MQSLPKEMPLASVFFNFHELNSGEPRAKHKDPYHRTDDQQLDDRPVGAPEQTFPKRELNAKDWTQKIDSIGL